MNQMDVINEVLTRGVQDILPNKKGLADLMRKRKITLYQGFDPTAPSLHIGNFIGLRKLAQFQKLGHKVVFLIGDFTGLIGDPTDKEAARTKQTRDEVLTNLKDYKKQAGRVLDFDGPNKAIVLFNYDWLSKLTFAEVIELASLFTVQQMLERDMFQKRIKNDKPIYLHEFLYPLMQGYDSVNMIPGGVDLEIGGNDQLFNMMAGRTLMKELKGKEKYVLTLKLLTDTNGKKMGKSEGNAVFLSDTPEQIYGKIMSWPDGFINSATELLTDIPAGTIKRLGAMDAKKMLAFDVVNQTHGNNYAINAQKSFEASFQKKNSDYTTEVNLNGNLDKTIAPFTSKRSVSEAKRLITQGGVDVNGKVVTDPNFVPKVGDKIKIGKKTFGTVVK